MYIDWSQKRIVIRFFVKWYINHDIEEGADSDEVLKKISKEFEKLRDMAEKYEEFLEYKDRLS